MTKKYRLELYVEMEVECNQFLTKEEVLDLVDPKVVLKDLVDIKINSFEMSHDVSEHIDTELENLK